MPFDMNLLQQALQTSRIIFRVHALQKMSSRAISRDELCEALDNAEMIKDYPQKKPYPSALLLGSTAEGRPLHIAAALDETGRLIIITVYEPDPTVWTTDWRSRRK
jgi:hypothetical protein